MYRTPPSSSLRWFSWSRHLDFAIIYACNPKRHRLVDVPRQNQEKKIVVIIKNAAAVYSEFKLNLWIHKIPSHTHAHAQFTLVAEILQSQKFKANAIILKIYRGMSGQICRLCLKCTNGFAIRPLHHPRAHTMDEFFISSFTPIYVFSAMRLCYHALSHRVIESESQSRVRKMALIKLQHHSKKWINHKTQRTKRWEDESYSKRHTEQWWWWRWSADTIETKMMQNTTKNS